MSADAALLETGELAALARRFARERIARRPAVADGDALWRQITELGWPALPVAERHGGLGQPLAAVAAIYRELGRALSASPYMETMLLADALTAAATPFADALLGAIVAGDVRGAVPAGLQASSIQGMWASDGIDLSGAASFMLRAAEATHALVPVTLDGARALAVVALDAPGLTERPLELWDRTRRASEIAFERTRISPDQLITRGAAAADFAAHLDIAVASDSLGGAEAVFEDTVAYLLVRHQFGQPIGSFQALQHRCADLNTHLSAAEALLDEAVAAVSARQPDAAASALAAKLYCVSVYRQVAMEAVQLHGGIGFTWEHDCHLFLKRACLNEQLGLSPRAGRDQLAALWLDKMPDERGERRT